MTELNSAEAAKLRSAAKMLDANEPHIDECTWLLDRTNPAEPVLRTVRELKAMGRFP